MHTSPTSLRALASVAVGGAIGAVARVALAASFPATPGRLPWATLMENVAGAFLLAVILTLLLQRTHLPAELRLLVGTGALGAFTTYSTMAVEMTELLRDGHLAVAGAYAAGSLVLGITAALAGVAVAGAAAPGRDAGEPDQGGRA